MHCPCIHSWFVSLSILQCQNVFPCTYFSLSPLNCNQFTVSWHVAKSIPYPTCKASTRGLQYFNGNLTRSSLMVSQLIDCFYLLLIARYLLPGLMVWHEECEFSWIKYLMKAKTTLLFYITMTILLDSTKIIASIFNSFSCKCGSSTFVPKCIILAKCWIVHFLVHLIGCCFHGINGNY